jgi:hypothetical protein
LLVHSCCLHNLVVAQDGQEAQGESFFTREFNGFDELGPTLGADHRPAWRC